MGQRVVVGLEPNADWALVRDTLMAEGAEVVREPSRELPDVLVVSIPSERDLDKFLSRAKQLVGVRYAEPDAWQSTF